VRSCSTSQRRRRLPALADLQRAARVLRLLALRRSPPLSARSRRASRLPSRPCDADAGAESRRSGTTTTRRQDGQEATHFGQARRRPAGTRFVASQRESDVPGERVRTSNERWIVLHRAIVTDGVGIDRAVAGNVRTVHTTEVRMTKPRLRLTSVTIGAAVRASSPTSTQRLLGWPVVAEDPPRPSEPPMTAGLQLGGRPASRVPP